MLVLCGPSGVGKGTLSKLLMRDATLGPYFAFSVSHTTRPLRPAEVESVDYYKVSEEEFQRGVDQKDFLEHSRAPQGTLYGTSVDEVERLSKCGKIALMDLDLVGVRSLKGMAAAKKLDVRCLGVVVERDELEARLRGRGTESEQELLQRLDRSQEEIEFCKNSSLVDATIFNTDSWRVGYPLLVQHVVDWWPDVAMVKK